MAINIDGTIYRNIQQQVAKNTDDIDKLKKSGTGGSSYTAGNGIDITNNTISIDNTVVATKSEIPTVNDPTITFTQGGVTKGTITLNQSSNQTIALDAGGSGNNELYMAHILIQPNQVGVSVPNCVFDFNIPITKTDASIAPGLITSATLDQIMTNTCNAFGYSDPNYDAKGIIVTANGLYAVDNGDSTYTNCLVTAVSVTTKRSTGELIGGLSHFKLYKFENLNRLTNVLFNDVYQIPYLNINFTPYKLI